MCYLSLFIERCRTCPCLQVSCVLFKAKQFFDYSHAQLIPVFFELISPPACVIFGYVFLPVHGHGHRHNVAFAGILEAKRRSLSCPLAGGQFCVQKDLRNPRISRLLRAEFWHRGEATLEYPLQCAGLRRILWEIGVCPSSISLISTVVFEGKYWVQYSLAPAFVAGDVRTKLNVKLESGFVHMAYFRKLCHDRMCCKSAVF